MSKRFGTRCISMMLCMALLWSLLAVGAALPASAATVINRIAVSIVDPVPSRNLRYECTVQTDGAFIDVDDDTYGDCQENGIIWFCGDTPLLTTTCFEVGKSYTVRIPLYCNSIEHTFANNVVCTVNGNEASLQFGSPGYICIEYTFPTLQGYTVSFHKGSGSGTMESITGIAGDYKLPACTFTPPNSSHEFKSWKLSTDDNDWYPGETVPVYQDITLTPTWKLIDSRQAIHSVVATSENMASIPVLYGKMDIPQFTVTSGSPAYITASTGNLRWQKKEGDTWVNSSGRFTPGEWRISTQVRIDDRTDATNEYVLGEPVTLTVNGQTWTPENEAGKPLVHENYSLLFFYSPTFVIEDDPSIRPPQPVESVHVRLERYALGASITTVTAQTDANVTVNVLGFLEMSGNSISDLESSQLASGVFSADKTYIVALEIIAKPGYDISGLFPEDVTVEQSTNDIQEHLSTDGERFNGMYLLQAPTTFTVTFTAGDSLNTTSTATNIADTYTLPACMFAPPACKAFKAWNVNGVEKKPGDTIVITADTTIAAVWKSAHTYKTTTTKATLTKDGKIYNKCTACGYIAGKATAIKRVKTVKLSYTSYTYNGKTKSPSVTVKDSAGKTLKKNTDYTVAYAKGRKNVGTYKVTVTFKGKYSGKKVLTFKINPPKTAVKSLSAAKKSLKVTISKKTKQVSGYQVQYSTSKKFTKATLKTVKSYKTTKCTLKSLKAKKTYYVRVRTYKTVSGKKYYSAWSTVQYKKTK